MCTALAGEMLLQSPYWKPYMERILGDLASFTFQETVSSPGRWSPSSWPGWVQRQTAQVQGMWYLQRNLFFFSEQVSAVAVLQTSTCGTSTKAVEDSLSFAEAHHCLEVPRRGKKPRSNWGNMHLYGQVELQCFSSLKPAYFFHLLASEHTVPAVWLQVAQWILV